MGADYLAMSLNEWEFKPLDYAAAKKAVSVEVAKDSAEELLRLDDYIFPDIDDQDASTVHAYVMETLHELVDEFENSLTDGDVTVDSFGPLFTYSTGGESWGDDPTEAFSVWNKTLYDELNPYADDIREALGFADPKDGVNQFTQWAILSNQPKK